MTDTTAVISTIIQHQYGRSLTFHQMEIVCGPARCPQIEYGEADECDEDILTLENMPREVKGGVFLT